MSDSCRILFQEDITKMHEITLPTIIKYDILYILKARNRLEYNKGYILMEIKRLTQDNIDEIKTLYKSIFTKEPWNDDWSDDEQLNLYIGELIGNQNSLTFGLFDNTELIGLSMGSIKHWYSSTEYKIEEFCIKNEKQGQGLGTEFLCHIEDTIKASGIKAILLQTERNVPAYDFYKKNGFSELCDHVSLKKNI